MSKLVAVVGLGKTGLSCVKYLLKQNVQIIAMDSRSQPPVLAELQANFPDIKLFLGGLDSKILETVDEIVLSPGISLHEPAIAAQVKRGIPVIGDIELFVRAATAPIVAITGSNGKSTVTTLVGEMAKMAGLNVQVGGNLGTPVLELNYESDLYVLELSSFQLETTFSLKAAAAVVLNISPDHMDRYKDLDEYTAAKKRVYENCKVAVVNRDEPYYDGKQPIYSFGLSVPKDGQFGVLDNYLAYGNEKLLAISDLRIKGQHQVANALAALALGMAVGLPMPAMLEALREFSGLPHRCEWIANIAGVDWYNDSKGTNVGATKAAIKGLGQDLGGKIILIAGGQGKGADFSTLTNVVKKHVRAVVLIGEDANIIAAALDNSKHMSLRATCLPKPWRRQKRSNPVIKYADSMREAVNLAKKSARSGDIVLLSPACASFDMFDNFEHRGKVFTTEVLKLQAEI